MQQALTSPLFRSVALGGLLLAMTAAAAGVGSPHTRHLVLHTVSKPCAVYLTAWRNGDVELKTSSDELEPLTFQTRARVNDGCQWLATETLVPISATRYSYRYEEQILRCRPGARPYLKTPRVGYVDVVE
jgi:hypothetical protein